MKVQDYKYFAPLHDDKCKHLVQDGWILIFCLEKHVGLL